MTETANRPEGCPTCGSDDPGLQRDQQGNTYRGDDGFVLCPDPFHTPSDSASEAEIGQKILRNVRDEPTPGRFSDSASEVDKAEDLLADEEELDAEMEAEKLADSASEEQWETKAIKLAAALTHARREAEEARKRGDVYLSECMRLERRLSDARELLVRLSQAPIPIEYRDLIDRFLSTPQRKGE